MSANLWSSTPTRTDGTYLCSKASGDLNCNVTGLSSLAEDQTVHMGAALMNSGVGVLIGAGG